MYIISEPFSVSLNIDETVTIYSGLSVYYVICDAREGQAVSWQWTFNGTTNLTRFTVFPERRSVLLLCDVTLADTGLYACTAKSSDGDIATTSTFIQVGEFLHDTAQPHITTTNTISMCLLNTIEYWKFSIGLPAQ